MKKGKLITVLTNQNIQYANYANETKIMKKIVAYLFSFNKIIQTNISENYHLKIENKRSPFALDVGFFDKNVKIDELIQLPGLCSSTRIKERKEKCSTFVNSFIT